MFGKPFVWDFSITEPTTLNVFRATWINLMMNVHDQFHTSRLRRTARPRVTITSIKIWPFNATDHGGFMLQHQIAIWLGNVLTWISLRMAVIKSALFLLVRLLGGCTRADNHENAGRDNPFAKLFLSPRLVQRCVTSKLDFGPVIVWCSINDEPGSSIDLRLK